MRWTYLLLDALTLVFPLAFSFHPRVAFYRQWRTTIPALFLTAALFVCWDSYFTHLGVWGFNSRYLTGASLANLPLEEWLFFLCIPYACVFTVFNLRDVCAGGAARTEKFVSAALVLILVVSACWNNTRRYTAITCLSLALLIAYCSFFQKAKWLGSFYISWLLLLLPLVVVDGILTGTGLQAPVVWYNPRDIAGIRLLTIPVEDIFYGMELVLLNAVLAAQFERRRRSKRIAAPVQKHAIALREQQRTKQPF